MTEEGTSDRGRDKRKGQMIEEGTRGRGKMTEEGTGDRGGDK